MRRTILAVVFVIAVLVHHAVPAATIQFLTPAGSPLGVAYGVDGLNVVGQDVLQRGFLYNGTTKTYTVIQPPGGGTTAAHGISGNLIVGSWGKLGFLYDGLSYTTLSHPLGVNGTLAYGISGNTIVGTYIDASNKGHGFVFDGTTYTTLNDPFGGISARGISGNKIVGAYLNTKNRTHGFIYNGTTYTTLDDPLFPAAGITALHGIDGSNIVGNTQTGTTLAAAFLYDGATFNHPFGIEGLFMGLHHQFFGISGNRIVGSYQDKPFVYVIPEPSSFLLAILGAGGLFAFARRSRNRASPT